MIDAVILIASLLLLSVCAWTAIGFVREKKRLSAIRRSKELESMDVFNLHPGTKAIWDIDSLRQGENPFKGYRLPSGKIVQSRYWVRLDGVEAKIEDD